MNDKTKKQKTPVSPVSIYTVIDYVKFINLRIT